MKGLKQVERERRAYHQDAKRNSVHRSSLTVPEIPGTITEISFLNHFLIKRNYSEVACRITAVDAEGKRIRSDLHKIEEPRVYQYTLTGMTQEPVTAYLVEFFCAENLFIPYPAVMVNHRGEHFHNAVHAYNRVLNDVFEQDARQEKYSIEASIDFFLEQDKKTFLLFSAGPYAVKEEIEIAVLNSNGEQRRSLPIRLPRFGNQWIDVREIFPEMAMGTKGVVKVHQPQQEMFYSRMLAGNLHSDGAFSANHSYYDCSHIEEYWDGVELAQRIYPFLPSMENLLRFYPIFSPCELDFRAQLFDKEGKEVVNAPVGSLTSPGKDFLELNYNQVAEKNGIELSGLSSFGVSAHSSGKMPTRIPNQVIQRTDGLEATFNVPLHTDKIFRPHKKGLKWGQGVIGQEVNTYLGLVDSFAQFDRKDAYEIFIDFYSIEGKVATKQFKGEGTRSIWVDFKKEFSGFWNKDPGAPTYLWYFITTDNPLLDAQTVIHQERSGHCSGEHSF